jgi:hypothetical protein
MYSMNIFRRHSYFTTTWVLLRTGITRQNHKKALVGVTKTSNVLGLEERH